MLRARLGLTKSLASSRPFVHFACAFVSSVKLVVYLGTLFPAFISQRPPVAADPSTSVSRQQRRLRASRDAITFAVSSRDLGYQIAPPALLS
jgi:hypothetical protein